MHLLEIPEGEIVIRTIQIIVFVMFVKFVLCFQNMLKVSIPSRQAFQRELSVNESLKNIWVYQINRTG